MADGADQGGQAESRETGEGNAAAPACLGPGDAAALACLVAQHQEGVSRLVHRLLGWSGDVEDVVQEVFLAAWQKRGQLRKAKSLAPWLSSIAVNCCRSYRRQRFLRVMLLGQRDEEACGAPNAGGMHRAIEDETAARVREAFRSLPGRYREIAVLRYLQEMPMDEICTALRIRPGAARVRLHRARQELRKRLAGLIEEEE